VEEAPVAPVAFEPRRRLAEPRELAHCTAAVPIQTNRGWCERGHLHHAGGRWRTARTDPHQFSTAAPMMRARRRRQMLGEDEEEMEEGKWAQLPDELMAKVNPR
jgi:hypothetical protein